MFLAKQSVWKWTAAGIRNQRFAYTTVKPGARAAVHGVRAPLPNSLDYFSPLNEDFEKGETQQHERDGAKNEEKELQLPQEKRNDPEEIDYLKNVNMASADETLEEGQRQWEEARNRGVAGVNLRNEEISSTNPNFRQTRRYSVAKEVKETGTEHRLASEGAEPFVERARESLEEVRRGVPSTQAGGVMTNVVRKFAYFEHPDAITYFKNVNMEATAEDTLELAAHLNEEARKRGDGVNPATQLLRKYMESQSSSTS
eukprot:TRINITY_DN1334_c0_g2_i1.p1 TRINITY_DN1334_c0_g2~~TRINITY_DN1334_c0_g2_i1.p1  ORF type:complete len:257 (-),score=61.42 TRINITY_DN1334_c0_g2_i1:267-1037(-)